MATNRPRRTVRERIAARVATPVDIASLAAFRFLFGLVLLAAIVRFISKGWVRELYVEPAFHFAYPGFEWIRPWPDAFMHLHFVLLALLAVGVALGFFYRICITLFFLGFTFVELLDQPAYLNHYYLISLISGLMIFLPANRAWSIDAWRKPGIRVDTVSAWCLNVLRFQVGVVYLFAGLAKLNADWLFQAQPLRIWLAARSDLPMVGWWLDKLWVAYAASWLGAIFDLCIVFFLLGQPTRRPAYALLVVFHVATGLLFNIGMFPWIMIVAATLFFPAGWPRYWLARFSMFLSSRFKSVQLARRVHAAVALEHAPRRPPGRATGCLLAVLSSYAAVQLALPLRPYFALEPSAWTGSGFNCAWQVMVAEKTGFAEFYAGDSATGRRRKLSLKSYLTPRQEAMMAQDPYLIQSMARRLAADLKDRGLSNVQIKVNAFATLNGRPSQQLINNEVDLAGTLSPGWIQSLAHRED